MGDIRSVIQENAAELQALYAKIGETFALLPHGPEHSAACQKFHEEYDRLAFPGGLKHGMESLHSHDPDAIRIAIDFLELSPRFHRSGYIREKILRRLKTAPLDDSQTRRLVRLILRSIDSGGRRDAHAYAALAGALLSPEIEDGAIRRVGKDPETRRRTANVLHVMRSRRMGRQPRGSP